MNPNDKRMGWINTGIQTMMSPIPNKEDLLFAGARPIYPASAKGFNPLKAQFRRAEIYKRALEMFVEDHNDWVMNAYGPEVACEQYDIDVYINNAKIEIDNGK